MRWGIIGPGAIAQDFHRGVNGSRTGKLVAIGTRNPKKEGLAETFPGARILDGYQALLDDPEVEAVYIATPHPGHAEWAIKAAEAGKHVLVEKPMALTAFEVDAIFHAHRKAGTFAGEAFMYRLHPQTAKLGELIASGAIGEVRMIQSSFGFQMPSFMPEHRLFANDLAGGGILDVGGYPVSMARFIAGAAAGKPFLDPVKVSGTAHLGQAGTDEWSAAVLQFENGIVAQVSCAVFVQLDNVLRIHGANGPHRGAGFLVRRRHPGSGARQDRRHPARRQARDDQRERDRAPLFLRGRRGGRGDPRRPAGIFAARHELGRQPRQCPRARQVARRRGPRIRHRKAGAAHPHARGPQAQGRRRRSRRRSLPGLPKELSVVALGFEDFRTFSSGAILLDAFWEAGGNLFDTAFVYGAGYTEKLFGDWHTSRGVREEAVLIGKGAHTPLCYPDVIEKQLTQSLDRLKTDYVDIYFMHRDNPDVPVGEFVDAMDAEVKKGRIRGIFGGSNWTRERIDAANAYAEAQRQAGLRRALQQFRARRDAGCRSGPAA